MRPEPGTPLYVHLPFCAAKCHYCDFYSLPGEGQDLDGAVEALLAEAEGLAPRDPRTVFLGGGTPSYFDGAQLRRLLDGLDRVTGFRASADEVTAECNPESLDRDKAALLLELGVDRLSIGFQSLQDSVLQLFGRVHDSAASFRAYEAARAAGCERVSIDLIYAFPGHRAEDWEAELERVLALRPDHLSAYNLTFEEQTPFARWLETGRLQPLDEERELELFWLGREVLERHGFAAYEVSNYSLSGEQCAHNLNYWRNGSYLGLGPSAVSLVRGERSGNPRSLAEWRGRVGAGVDPRVWRERLAPLPRLAETWWLGLRLAEGVEPVRARAVAGWEGPADPCLAVAAELEGQGWLARRGAAFHLSRKGLPLADAIARRFLAAARSPGDAGLGDAGLAGACAQPGKGAAAQLETDAAPQPGKGAAARPGAGATKG